MTKHHKRLIVGLGVGIVVGTAAIAGPAFIGRASGAGPETTDSVRVVEDHKLPAQWVINAAYGRGALSNLRAALDEIAKNNDEEAKKGIAVAQSLLAKIKRGSPPDAHTHSANPGTSAGDSPEGELILVHSEVRVLRDSDENNSLQSKLEDIRRELEMNDHEAIISALESLNVPLAYTRVDLPLDKTMLLVKESLEALQSNDAQRARSKLLEIGDGLHVETVRVGIKDAPADAVDAG